MSWWDRCCGSGCWRGSANKPNTREEEGGEEQEEEEEEEPGLAPPPPASKASKLLASKLKKASSQADTKGQGQSSSDNRTRALSPAVAKRFMQHALGVRIETHESLGLHSKVTSVVDTGSKRADKKLAPSKAPVSSSSSGLNRRKASSSIKRKILNSDQKYLPLQDQPTYKAYIPNPTTDGTCQNMCPTAHMSPAEVSECSCSYVHI